MAEAEAEAEVSLWVFFIRIKMINQYILVLHSLIKVYLKLMSFCLYTLSLNVCTLFIQ